MRTLLAFLVVPSLFAVAAAQAQGPRVAVLPVKFLDTSAEPQDQAREHERRTAALTAAIATELDRKGLFQTVTISPDAVQRTCPQESTDCLLAAARSQGAKLVFFGVVHKSSTLIMHMWARFADASTGQVVFSRDLNFRGDNDDAWRRAQLFLIEQIEAAPPQ